MRRQTGVESAGAPDPNTEEILARTRAIEAEALRKARRPERARRLREMLAARPETQR